MQNTSVASSIFDPSRTKKRIKRRSRRKNSIHATITTIAACVAVTFCYTTTTEAFSSLMENTLSPTSTHGLPLHLIYSRFGTNPNGLSMELSVVQPWRRRTTTASHRSSSLTRMEAVTPGFHTTGLGGYEKRASSSSSSLHRLSMASKTMIMTEGDVNVRGQQPRTQRSRSGKSVAAVKELERPDNAELRGDRGRKTNYDDDENSSGTMVRERNLSNLFRLTSSYGLDYSDGIHIRDGSGFLDDVHTSEQAMTDSGRKQGDKDETKVQSESSPNTLPSSSSVFPSYFNSQGKKNGRSSTMPGFVNDKTSKRHRAFQDGLLLAKQANDQETARRIEKMLTSEKEVQRRRKVNSEAMYSSSASVPDSFVAFANEIHKVSRITPKEEMELGTKTQQAIHIQKVRDELEVKLRRDPTNSEWCSAAGMKNMEELEVALKEGLEAKQRLVTSNLRMVQRVVNLYIRNGLGSQYNAGDLMQEGIIALIRAAEKFEPSRGFRFSTYAMYWIRAAVKRSQIIQSRVISVPQRLHETHKKITKTEYELKKELGRKPKKSELAGAVGISEVQLDRCLSAIAQQCLSLDAELENTVNPNKSNSNKETLYNILAAKYDNVEFKQLKNDLLKEDLIDSLRRYLSPREVDLLLLRYGLMDEKTLRFGFSGPLTIAEVSRLVGLKPDKVRRIINKSLRQLRHLIAHEWEDFEKELS